MTGYVVVNRTSFFAVTDATGSAKIDLPAGKYTSRRGTRSSA